LTRKSTELKEMNALEQQLNNAIEKYGFRISPRLSMEDRLTRYIQMLYEREWETRGPITEREARGAAGLLMLNPGNINLVHRRVEDTRDGNLRVTLSATPETRQLRPRPQMQTWTAGTHSMVRRSQVSRA
jgi:hypothetical protein